MEMRHRVAEAVASVAFIQSAMEGEKTNCVAGHARAIGSVSDTEVAQNLRSDCGRANHCGDELAPGALASDLRLRAQAT
jgi:hypothetical protein